MVPAPPDWVLFVLGFLGAFSCYIHNLYLYLICFTFQVYHGKCTDFFVVVNNVLGFAKKEN